MMTTTPSYVEFDDEEAAELIPIMIFVTAPSNLEAGCEFEAYENGDKNRPFTCIVVSKYHRSLKRNNCS